MRVLKPNNIDFRRRAEEDPVKSAKQRRSFLLVLPLVLIVLGIAGLEGWYIYRMRTQLQPQIDKLDEYVLDTQVLTDYDAAMQLSYQRDMLQGEYDNLTTAKAAINSYPEFTVGLYSKITAAAGANVEVISVTFDRATGAVGIVASTPDMARVPAFIKALKAALVFGDAVDYTGESWQDNGAFGFAVSCVMAEG